MARVIGKNNILARERERGGFGTFTYILQISLSDSPRKYKSVVKRIPTGVTRTEGVLHWCDEDTTAILLTLSLRSFQGL